jgi:hypothetical protein
MPAELQLHSLLKRHVVLLCSRVAHWWAPWSDEAEDDNAAMWVLLMLPAAVAHLAAMLHQLWAPREGARGRARRVLPQRL